LAPENALHDVEEHDIAELLEARQQRQCPANLSRADQCNFVSRHRIKILD
jgi:hypothetical protein